MRRSELLGLRWSDIDLTLFQISVNCALHQLVDRSLVFRQPKTDKGRRVVSLSPSIAEVLRGHRKQQELLKQCAGLPFSDDDLVFSQLDGTPLLPDTVSHAWRKLTKRTGLKRIRMHDARHTHASLMLKQGVHPKIVQERLGHASIQITLDTYSHVIPGIQQAAANLFDQIVVPDKNDTTVEILR